MISPYYVFAPQKQATTKQTEVGAIKQVIQLFSHRHYVKWNT